MTTIPAPAAPQLYWDASALVERGVVVYLHETTADTIQWGDGTTSPYNGVPVTHVYDRPHAYVVTAMSGDTAVTRLAVYVRAGIKPAIVVDESVPNTAVLFVSGLPLEILHELRIDWGDGSSPQVGKWWTGQEIRHAYASGSYDITISDAVTGRIGRYPITVSGRLDDPVFTVTQRDQSLGVTISVSSLSSPGKALVIDWGDFNTATIPAAQVGSTASHSYSGPGQVILQLAYADGSTDGSAQLISVPLPDGRDSQGGAS